jgi:nucleotide-binding universal stress UspA family protein
MPAWVDPALHRREVRKAEERLRGAAARLLRALDDSRHGEVQVRTILAQGEPAPEILRRSARVELVVVGRHGRRTFRDLLVGSTSERVVRHAIVPTLVVAGPARSSYRRPVVAVERDSSSRATLELAVRLVGTDQRALEVVHAYHAAHEALLARAATPAGRAAYRRECREDACRAIAALVRRTGATPAVRGMRLRRADPRQAVLGAARARRADLIVVGTHGRSGLAHALMGSVAEAVMRHAECDVLVAPPRRSARPLRGRPA